MKLTKSFFSAGNYHEQIHIENNSTGNSYERLLSRFFEATVRHIEVDDPYIRSAHQVSHGDDYVYYFIIFYVYFLCLSMACTCILYHKARIETNTVSHVYFAGLIFSSQISQIIIYISLCYLYKV